MNTLRATPRCPNITKEFLKYSFLCASTLSISGCITSDPSAPLAPSPEKVFSTHNNDFAIAKNTGADGHGDDKEIVAQNIHLSPMLQNLMVQGLVHNGSVMASDGGEGQSASLKSSGGSSYKCRWKDRLDRKAVLAYEWDRSRLSMDVDGVNLSGDGEYGMRVAYRLRFQPEKPPKERCRYKAAWQGMIGTGYHEFFVREEDTVWQAIKQDVRDAKKKVTNVTGRIF